MVVEPEIGNHQVLLVEKSSEIDASRELAVIKTFRITSWTAVLLLGTCLTAAGAAPNSHTAKPIRAFLCDSADHAIQFADVRANGDSEELARDRIGRTAGHEVCGYYRGIAVIQSEDISLQGGVAYKVTAYRFQEDKRVAWLAERTFGPASGTNHEWEL